MAYYNHQVNEHYQQWFDVFYADKNDCAEWNENEDLVQGWNDEYEPGFYYCYGLPGCLYDSEPFGPYTNEQEAVAAAIEQLEY
jgi:hypothetical protein